MFSDGLLSGMLTTLNLGRKTRKNDSPCKKLDSSMSFLRGVSTTVRQDYQWTPSNSDDSGISGDLEFRQLNLFSQQQPKFFPKKAVGALPHKTSGFPRLSAGSNKSHTQLLEVKNPAVYAMSRTSGGPVSFIHISASRLRVDNLLSRLLQRTNDAGLPVRHLPIFFESLNQQVSSSAPRTDANCLRRSQMPLGAANEWLPVIISGNEEYQSVRRLGQGNFGRVYLCHVHRSYSNLSLVPFNFRALKMTRNLHIHDLELRAHKLLQWNHTEQSYSRTFLVWMAAGMKIPSRENRETIMGFLLLELAPGGSLQNLLADLQNAGRRLNEREAAFYLAEMACALDYMHSRGCVHLDFKADNILLTAHGHARLADFGHSVRLNHLGVGLSSLVAGLETFHLPPELLRNAPLCANGRQRAGKLVTKSADWFSFGCFAFWLVHHAYPILPPKELKSVAEYAEFMETAGYSQLHLAFCHSLTTSYRQLVLKLLHPRPRQRLNSFIGVLRHSEVFADCFSTNATDLAEARALIEANCLLPPFVPIPQYG